MIKFTKLFFLVFLTAIPAVSSFSQDLVVTSENDSLNCKITDINKNNIHFTFKHKGEVRQIFLPLTQVKAYQYNFYQRGELSTQQVLPSEKYKHLRIALSGGWGYRIASVAPSIPSEFKQYINDLKSGYQLGLDCSYFLSEPLAIGFKYNFCKSANEMNTMSDDITIRFMGPSVTTRLLNSSKQNGIIVSLALGYLHYYDKAILANNHFDLKGGTVGMCWDLGYDIAFSNNWVFGFQFSYYVGTLNQYTKSDGFKSETVNLKGENRENLSRIDLSIGLRLYL